MSKKISKEEFLKRFYRNYPEADIEILEYSAISNPAAIKCKKCGKIFRPTKARYILNNFKCCDILNITKLERLKRLYEQSENFDFVKQVDKDHFIVHHNICGNDLKRVIQNSLDNPYACIHCDNGVQSNRLSIQEVQDRINEVFGNSIQILEYNGQLYTNTYKCLKCGLIFKQKQVCLMESRGCPKCDRYRSKGEKQVTTFLKNNNVIFKEQVRVKELPLQSFDFGLYENDKIIGFIEVQGEQHREKREIFRDSLEIIQQRDERKRKYCKDNNIPLYELIYEKGKILNIDILPFNSTTISVKESTL